jgi:hypothetical protein
VEKLTVSGRELKIFKDFKFSTEMKPVQIKLEIGA